MNLIILFMLLLITLIILYINNGKIFFKASFILVSMFLVGTLTAIFNFYYTGYDIKLITSLIIFEAIFLFLIGEIVGEKISIKYKPHKIQKFKKKINKPLQIKLFFLCFLFILGIIVSYFNFKYVYDLSLSAGNVFGVEGMLAYAYYAKWNPEIYFDQHFLLTQGLFLIQVMAYISIFFLIFNKVYFKKTKYYFLYYSIILIYIFNAFLNTGRTPFIRLISFMIVSYALLAFLKRKRNSFINLKPIVIAILGIILFMIIYNFYGELRLSNNTGLYNLLMYPGQSLFALDIYISGPRDNPFFGSETLVTIYSTLRKIGFKIPYKNLALPFVYWNGSSTNIYTAFRRYINDYGLFGLFIIQFLIGLFFGILYSKVIKTRNIIFIFLYCFFIYVVIESLFEERFFISIISVSTIYLMFYGYVIFHLFYKNRNIYIKSEYLDSN